MSKTTERPIWPEQTRPPSSYNQGGLYDDDIMDENVDVLDMVVEWAVVMCPVGHMPINPLTAHHHIQNFTHEAPFYGPA